MRFVAIKNEQQQGALMLHRTRELLVRQGTMLVNAIRGHMAEFADQALDGGDLIRLVVDLDVAEDEPAVDLEGTHQVRRRPVVETVAGTDRASVDPEEIAEFRVKAYREAAKRPRVSNSSPAAAWSWVHS